MTCFRLHIALSGTCLSVYLIQGVFQINLQLFVFDIVVVMYFIVITITHRTLILVSRLNVLLRKANESIVCLVDNTFTINFVYTIAVANTTI